MAYTNHLNVPIQLLLHHVVVLRGTTWRNQ
ncbi:hypothetical protein J2W67_001825 [Acinetobacter calcoaceticus]|uniref:Uncharacterized protein n=1 Tax=Acinetobacter calcoaceticus TaxID=471 RepID=A0ABD5AS83_ACICA|nr:hypothetical protein [Acinetobacter calcoaceticus]MDR6796709.1 hypothetical protein [Acinetobacter calcoaceticus]